MVKNHTFHSSFVIYLLAVVELSVKLNTMNNHYLSTAVR